MKAIEEIKNRLQRYPQAKFEIQGNRITILSMDENGFSVSLVDNSPDYTVFFDAWHDEYTDVEKALNAFAFGLSNDCRLKITYRGRSALVWTVEERDENGGWFPCQWIGCNEMGLMVLPPFWLKKRYVYLQNTLLKSAG